MSEPGTPDRIVVMGVSGCGKSTVGQMIGRLLDLEYFDADELHPNANVTKMAAGIPLSDEDRWPWLRIVGTKLAACPDGAVVACSALRRPYRDLLRALAPGTAFVHLSGTRDELAKRMATRDHFMPLSLLDSQLVTLEPLQADEAGVTLDIGAPGDRIAAAAAAWVRRT